jgi:hypothetical protein
VNPARFYKRPVALRALPRVVPRPAEDPTPAPPPLPWRSRRELCLVAEDLGIEPARMNRQELLAAIRDSISPMQARSLGLPTAR